MLSENSKAVWTGGEAYFLTLSAGIAMIQNEKAPSPPDRKFAKPVLIYNRLLLQRT